MLDAAADVGDHLAHAGAAIRTRLVVDEHAHRLVVLADAIDAAGQMEFGAERDLEEAVGDLGVGELLASRAAA